MVIDNDISELINSQPVKVISNIIDMLGGGGGDVALSPDEIRKKIQTVPKNDLAPGNDSGSLGHGPGEAPGTSAPKDKFGRISGNYKTDPPRRAFHPYQPSPGYRIPQNGYTEVSAIAQEVLHRAMAEKWPMPSEIPFVHNGKKWLARFQRHGPNSGHKTEHNGVGVYEADPNYDGNPYVQPIVSQTSQAPEMSKDGFKCPIHGGWVNYGYFSASPILRGDGTTRSHEGVDMRPNETNAPVYSIGEGTVTGISFDIERESAPYNYGKKQGKTYSINDDKIVSAPNQNTMGGTTVTISHKDGKIVSYYAHLKSVKVKPGDEVDSDTVIGTVGASGNAKGFEHLHFGIKDSGVWSNPVNYMALNAPVFTSGPKVKKPAKKAAGAGFGELKAIAEKFEAALISNSYQSST